MRLPKPPEQEIQQDYWVAQAVQARNSERLLGCPSRPSKKFRKIQTVKKSQKRRTNDQPTVKKQQKTRTNQPKREKARFH